MISKSNVNLRQYISTGKIKHEYIILSSIETPLSLEQKKAL